MTTRTIKIKSKQTVLNEEPRKILINTTPVEQKRKVIINLTPTSVIASQDKPKQKIRFHITKRSSHNEYEIAMAEQKPKFITHEPVILPPKLQLEPFFHQNYCYLMDQSTKYIFLPDDIQMRNIVPIGRLIEQQIDPKNITKSSYPLVNRRVDWYLRYELDAPIHQ